MGPIDTYLVDVVRVGGPLLLIAAIGLLALGVEGALSKRLRIVLGSMTAIAALLAVAQVAPVGESGQLIKASVVQAGGQLGTNAATSDQLAVLDRHLAAVDRHVVDTDLMVWSESSVTTYAPLESSSELSTISELANKLDAVIIANISEIKGNKFRNTTVSIDPGKGLRALYD